MNEVRKEQNRKQFIQVAYDLIEEDGVQAATIRNIANKTGYNSATLYSYFSNLSELQLAVKLYYDEQITIKIKSQVKWEKNDIYELWAQVYMSMFDFYMEHPNAYELSFLSKFTPQETCAMLEKQEEVSELQKYCRSSFERVDKEYHIPSDVIERVNDILLSMMVGTLLRVVRGRNRNNAVKIRSNMERDLKEILHSTIIA